MYVKMTDCHLNFFAFARLLSFVCSFTPYIALQLFALIIGNSAGGEIMWEKLIGYGRVLIAV
jgi:hypothetical protein